MRCGIIAMFTVGSDIMKESLSDAWQTLSCKLWKNMRTVSRIRNIIQMPLHWTHYQQKNNRMRYVPLSLFSRHKRLHLIIAFATVQGQQQTPIDSFSRRRL